MKKIAVNKVAEMQKYLTQDQQFKLHNMLQKHQVFFKGKLGCYQHQKFYLFLINNMELVYIKPYNDLYQQEELFVEELQWLLQERCFRESQ